MVEEAADAGGGTVSGVCGVRGWTDTGTPRGCFHGDGNYRPGWV